MELPAKLRQAIEVAHAQMLADPHCSLLARQRLPIYEAIAKSEPVAGKKAQGWLAFLTAQKVLPIWQEEDPLDTYGRNMLELIQALLTGNITLVEMKKNHQTMVGSIGIGLGESAWDYSDEANYAFVAPGLALAEAMGDFLYKRDPENLIQITQRQIETGLPDEMMASLNGETVAAAVCAYSGVSFDWDIINHMSHSDLADDAKVLNIVNTTFAPNFKPEKRQEFWQWWLTEAIPQAWELTQR